MSNKTVFKEILKEYDNLTLQAYKLEAQRKQEIYESIPEIKAIDEKISELGIKTSKLILSNYEKRKTAEKEIQENINFLKTQKQELIRNSHFPDNYLTDIYKCNICKDTGFVNFEKCSCFKQKLIEIYYNMSNIKNILEKENFENFDFRFFSDIKDPKTGVSQRNLMENVYKICSKFVSNFPNEFKNLLFYGHAGRGKTFLCNCIAKDILDKGKSVVYITAHDLFKTIEENRFGNKDEIESFENKIDIFYNVDLLIIDDLGTEISTSITQSVFFNIINDRLIKKNHTIISTNLSPKDLQKNYSDRILSRFSGSYMIIKLTGEDIRIKKKYNLKK